MDNMTFLSNEHDIDDDDNVDDEQQQQIYPTTMVIISANTLHPQTLPVIDDDLQEKGVHLTIIEEPINRIRYRYRSEKGSHGGLNGVNSCPIRKTYPTVKIENYHLSNPVYVRASLATNELQPKLHVHKLMGRHCSADGSCTLPVNLDNMTAIFQNLGILFIGKKEVQEILYRRKSSSHQLNRRRLLRRTGQQQQQQHCLNNQQLRRQLQLEAEKEAKDLNLNSVRIRFEAFMLCATTTTNNQKWNWKRNNFFYGRYVHLSTRNRLPIKVKSPDSGELRIVRLNRFYGSVIGGDEIYLLCEKVNKKEIRIRFFEIDNDGNQQWESFGQFNESDVHHQVAIVFRTPPYRNVEITKPIQVYIQLFRQRDGESSEPRTFIYKPQDESISNDSLDIDDHNLLKQIKMENQSGKRRKYCPNINQQQQHNNKNRKQQQQNENLNNEQKFFVIIANLRTKFV
ncbi:nuclear factor nf-kappa-b p105 subunit-like protein [Dermatophagoides farinae]|uniref:Nuclear factor nf-kappa-b p105 subunit-like protein n=1 Tax=Dermatophagoides farinae TaxID=6954 RepID=A0A9D4NSX9_DERFA|nr:nuclear factor nf-kappa-b p105 subunit-like protein [Dermatophagoides farinae]